MFSRKPRSGAMLFSMFMAPVFAMADADGNPAASSGGGGAVGGTPAAAATAATDSAAVSTTPREDKTRIIESRSILDAFKPDKGYRRFVIKDANGAERYVVAREQQRAVGIVALAAGYSVTDLDRRGPGRPSGKTVEQEIEAMTPEQRRALLEKYLGTAGVTANPAGKPVAVSGSGSLPAGAKRK